LTTTFESNTWVSFPCAYDTLNQHAPNVFAHSVCAFVRLMRTTRSICVLLLSLLTQFVSLYAFCYNTLTLCAPDFAHSVCTCVRLLRTTRSLCMPLVSFLAQSVRAKLEGLRAKTEADLHAAHTETGETKAALEGKVRVCERVC